nr:MAG: capsid protein [Cressdnaviricota sp.]
MPSFRKRSSRRTSKPRSARGLASKALRSVSFIKRTMRPETKFVDNSQLSANVSYGGTVELLSDIPQGTTVNQRIGNKVNIKSIWIKGFAKANTAVTGGAQTVRNILFIDKMDRGSGTAPTITDLLQCPGTDESSVIAPLNISELGRFKILYDKSIQLPNSTSTNGSARKPFTVFKRLNIPVHYTSTGSTNTWKNNVYFLTCSDVNSNDAEVTYYARVGFTDM